MAGRRLELRRAGGWEDLVVYGDADSAAGLNDTTIKPTEAEDLAVPRGRDRGSYDGDTAIKLYLREIGQVKLLTPQELGLDPERSALQRGGRAPESNR